jgi:hypothetical protein
MRVGWIKLAAAICCAALSASGCGDDPEPSGERTIQQQHAPSSAPTFDTDNYARLLEQVIAEGLGAKSIDAACDQEIGHFPCNYVSMTAADISLVHVTISVPPGATARQVRTYVQHAGLVIFGQVITRAPGLELLVFHDAAGRKIGTFSRSDHPLGVIEDAAEGEN